jgi:cell division protein ZapE
LSEVHANPSPLQLYEGSKTAGKILPDDAQKNAVMQLQAVHDAFLQRWRRANAVTGKLRALFGMEKADPILGLYLWGGVGRGKTFLMDLFFHSLPTPRKLRMHFHRFMLMVHNRLAQAAGIANPLDHVAESIAREAEVLCLDEFFVSDIGDAMILANLLEALFERGGVLVTTSNIPPDQLYETGLQRKQFLPAIALIRKYTKVVNVDGGVDYRMRSWERAPLFHCPANAVSEEKLAALFRDLAQEQVVEEGKILEVQGRSIESKRCGDEVVWFDFKQICTSPRGAADYIELARLFHSVIVSHVPVFNEKNNDEARRFITMIDEFYDRKVKIALSAMADLDHLHEGGGLAFPFERTRSRLLEMQTREYLAMPHNPE